MAKSRYITPEGFAALERELDELWKLERPKVTEAVARAAALGDRSENADYIYGKKRLREIDSRVRFLQKRIDELEVVRERPARDDTVYFGAWVTLEDEAGDEVVYRVVGSDESDASRGFISMESPVGRALLGAVLEAEVRVVRPKGAVTWTVTAIRYDPPPE